MDLIVRAIQALRNAGVDVSLRGDVIVCVVPEGTNLLCSLRILQEHAGEARDCLRQELEWFERELTSP